MAISSDGFVPARRTARPIPRPATLGDFLSKNAFADLSRREPARASAPGDDGNRVVSPPRSPGQKTSLFSQKASKTILFSQKAVQKTILFSQKVSRASPASSRASPSSSQDAITATATAHRRETGGRRATADDNHNDDDHNDRRRDKPVTCQRGGAANQGGPPPTTTTATTYDWLGPATTRHLPTHSAVTSGEGWLPPLTSPRQAKRHGADRPT